MPLASKYKVGFMSRKSLLVAIEILFDSDNDSIVYTNTHARHPYEIRARRVPHGIELKWGKPGTFFQPKETN